MKSLAIGAAIVVSLGLTACTGTSNRMSRSDSPDSRIDMVKVVGVNQWAERRGARVMWVNYPLIRDKVNEG